MVDQNLGDISSVGLVVKKKCVAAQYYLTKAILGGKTPTTHMLHRMTQGCVQSTQVIQKGKYKAYRR